jgi:hypothetical protein
LIKIILYRYLIVDILALIAAYYVGGYEWVLNLQVAFVNALIILFASFFSYKKMIKRDAEALQANEVEIKEEDELAPFDDKYELFDDEEYDELTKPGFKGTLKNLKVSLFSALSFYRIASYLLLIYGFFFLIDNNFFSIVPYILGFSIIPLSTLVFSRAIQQQKEP